MTRVHIQDLSIRFGNHDVIKHLDLDVHSGEFLVLLGPSGCGKSTLLHTIAGLNPVSGGSIHIGEQDATHAEPSQRGVGMVFQSYALYPNMTVKENLAFPLKMAKTPKAELEKRVAAAAEMLQLGPLLERRPGQLSGGQRQRVAIGRAVVREAKVLLLDEPLSNLDAKLRTDLRRELKQLHQRLGNTMIYVTHDQVEAMTLATRIVVMHQGVIQQIGTPAEVYDRPNNLRVAGFVGSPAINRLEGQVGEGGCFVSPALTLPLPAALASRQQGEALTLAVRPEHVKLGAEQPFAAQIQLVEPLGNQHVVWMNSAGCSVSAVLQGQPEVADGASVRFGFDTAKALWFNAEGERIPT
ncbi:ABC transporter ATP-binding protein [Pelomonas sp. UHG3]|uniref:ABC transporter ATP-binding protein n=1 Tax=Roseateles hydrophilus TaxID=2975054 RepID=A0ACC6CET6_9BURK|nr:ABC transporter ATP-binding protein [Pelomonas sp. UHG3]MCY4746946.1 ABC transporter ATP-binding protein [Pelomonas sp. UHG3]